MKKATLLLLATFSYIAAFAQDSGNHYLWPIQGQKAGTNIISAPQSYIDQEFNFGNMIITAPEGTNVVAPVDGTIKYFYVCYYDAFDSATSFHTKSTTFNGGIDELKDSFEEDPKYLTGSLSIEYGEGERMHITGLKGDIEFKTGQQIKRGDILGTIGHSYHKIKEPSLRIGINSKLTGGDPMTPFGIKSTYIPPKEIEPVTSLTKEQAKEDFLIAINSLKEVFPGIYDVVTENELENYVNKTIKEIDGYEGNLHFLEFWSIMKNVVAKIHDSHVGVAPPSWYKPNPAKVRYKIWMGWINDALICTNAIEEYRHLIGKEILSVNGVKAEDAKKIAASKVSNYDAKAMGYVDFNLALFGFTNLFRKDFGDYNYDMVLELGDGEKVKIESAVIEKGMAPFVNNIGPFMNANRRKGKYELKTLNDSTTYIGLSSFALNQVQVENIKSFIDSISDTKHLIFDVRNNGGGHVEVVEKLFSFIAEKPSQAKGYQLVNKKGRYDCFEHSLNYKGVDADIFPEYKREADGKYYLRGESGTEIEPDAQTNYKGKVYVLTNEFSVSGATLFPALVVRNGRGVIIGRETSTAYHFMNALKFVKIGLPNSTIVLTAPLVKIVFDDVVNERVPYGRGVMPDYYIPLSLDEMLSKNGDATLNYTLKLIEDGKYHNGSPFAE